MIFQCKNGLAKEQQIGSAINLVGGMHHNYQTIEGYQERNQDYETMIQGLNMNTNIYRQQALTAQLAGDIGSVRMFDRHIIQGEKLLDDMHRIYREWTPELRCGCGHTHTEENPLIYDPQFKKHFCYDCTIAFELDE